MLAVVSVSKQRLSRCGRCWIPGASVTDVAVRMTLTVGRCTVGWSGIRLRGRLGWLIRVQSRIRMGRQ